MLEQYDGPSYTIDDMRKYLRVHDRPILGTIIKPKMGLTSSEYAEVCYEFWAGGGDFVKNDEPQADQDFCPYDKMVKYVKKAMDKAVKEIFLISSLAAVYFSSLSTWRSSNLENCTVNFLFAFDVTQRFCYFDIP